MINKFKEIIIFANLHTYTIKQLEEYKLFVDKLFDASEKNIIDNILNFLIVLDQKLDNVYIPIPSYKIRSIEENKYINLKYKIVKEGIKNIISKIETMETDHIFK